MKVYNKNKTFEVDSDGFLVNYQEYCDEWKEYAANQAKVELSAEHLQVIDIIRDYYIERGQAPMIRYVAMTLKVLPSAIIKMFPQGLMTAIKIAGCPKP